MTNSEIFKKAHELTIYTMGIADDYRVTFAACLSLLLAKRKAN